MDSLTVYLNDIPVGRLTDDGRAMSFAYDPVYAADARNEPLSHSIPLSLEPFGQVVMEPFLSGLLPEDIIRTRLGRILQIPRENTFAFLKAIGGDCAGVIAFYPEVSARMAMKIDGEYAFKWITRGKFLRMAEKIGISSRTMDKEIGRMQKRIENHAPKVAEKLSARFPSPCYALIAEGIFRRSRQLMRR